MSGLRTNGVDNVARAAWLYYLEEMTQGEVARELNVSRSTVVRMLRRAKEMGLVKIKLDVSHETFRRERELERHYGLNKVCLVPETGDTERLKSWLGHAAAGLLESLVQPGATIAVSWGTTLQKMADSLAEERPVKGVRIVALSGGLHQASGGTNPYVIALALGQYFKAQTQMLQAPAFVEDRTTADALMRNNGIQETIGQARQATLAIFSVGTLDENATMVQLGYLSEKEREALRERGAVADIASHWINMNGDPVEPLKTINAIGIGIEDLKKIPIRLMIAGGHAKREAIHGALRGGYATVLVTDEPTAEYLLGTWQANSR